MALFAIQLVRLVLNNLPVSFAGPAAVSGVLVVGINEMFNVIVCVHFYFFYFTDNGFTWLGHRTNNNFGAGLNEIVFR